MKGSRPGLGPRQATAGPQLDRNVSKWSHVSQLEIAFSTWGTFLQIFSRQGDTKPDVHPGWLTALTTAPNLPGLVTVRCDLWGGWGIRLYSRQSFTAQAPSMLWLCPPLGPPGPGGRGEVERLQAGGFVAHIPTAHTFGRDSVTWPPLMPRRLGNVVQWYAGLERRWETVLGNYLF